MQKITVSGIYIWTRPRKRKKMEKKYEEKYVLKITKIMDESVVLMTIHSFFFYEETGLGCVYQWRGEMGQ